MNLDWKLTRETQTLLVNGHPFLANAKLRLDWRLCGREGWNESIAVTSQTPSDSSGTLTFEGVFANAVEVRIIFKRLEAQAWEINGYLHNIGADSIELARFHYLHGELAESFGLLAPQPHAEQCRLFRRGDRLPPVKEQMESLWESMGVTWPRFADGVHQQPDWAIAVETGIFTPAWDAPGLFLGYTSPVSAFGEIGLRTTSAQASCFVGLLLDGVRLDPGQGRSLDALTLRWGDWQESMRIWAKACAEQAGVKKLRAPLVGYCSWYQMYHEIELEHIERANREFADWPIPPGGRTIQIDDGFQIMPGDWRPNPRFAKTWSELPAQIAKTGSTPGLWLAPHAIFHRHPICTEHPDWLQRLSDDKPAISFSNWSWSVGPDGKPWDPTEPTHFLDPDHPEASSTSGNAQFYFDGSALGPYSEFGSNSLATTDTFANFGYNNEDLYIGATSDWPPGTIASCFNGSIDAVALFTTDLSASQIANMYQAAPPTADPATSAPTATANGVGVSNLLAYALGADPFAPAAQLLPTGAVANNFLNLNFSYQPTATDITYHVQASQDLVNWTDVWTSAGYQSGGANSLTISDNVPVSSANQRFLRLQVTQP